MRQAPPDNQADLRHMRRLLGLIEADKPGDLHDCSGCWDDFADSHDGPLLFVDPDTLRSRYRTWHDATYPPHPLREYFVVQFLAWIGGKRRESPVWSIRD